MEITSAQLDWTTEDIDLWRQFLTTRTGQRLIPKLLEGVPVLLPSGDTNAIMIRSGEVRGFSEAARTLLEMTAYPPPPQQPVDNNYPDLHDDKQWDGEKLNPDKQ